MIHTAGAYALQILFFPVLQLGHDGLHVSPDLFWGPLLAGHVGHAEIDQLLRAAVLEFAAGVAPFAIILIEGTVSLSAEGGVLQGHPAALADQLPGGAQQRVDGNVKKLGQQLQRFRVRRGLPRFP